MRFILYLIILFIPAAALPGGGDPNPVNCSALGEVVVKCTFCSTGGITGPPMKVMAEYFPRDKDCSAGINEVQAICQREYDTKYNVPQIIAAHMYYVIGSTHHIVTMPAACKSLDFPAFRGY